MDINLIVELKKEYTIMLCNMLVPHIYERMEDLYSVCEKNTEPSNVLKLFQECLNAIPRWTSEKINDNYNYVMEKANEGDYFLRLVKATFKVWVIVLSQGKVEQFDNLDVKKFVHQIYIECARYFFTNPFLFYKKLAAIEVKRNQVEINKLISTAIENAIRKLLFRTIFGVDNDNTKLIELSEGISVKKSDVTKSYNQKEQTGGNVTPTNKKDKLLNILNDVKLSESNDKFNSQVNYFTPKENMNSKYNSSRNTSHRNKSSRNTSRKSHSTTSTTRKSSETIKKIINESIHNSRVNTANDNIDSKIKQDIIKNLESDSLTYNPETDADNYQEVFGNTGGGDDTLNTLEKNENKSKEKFFNNYLNV